jgi:urea ABC transporter ATP-binding protein UrtE
MLRVKNICASYGTVQVLNDVGLDLKDNEVLGMIGRNGVGKTTLMRVLIGLLKSTKGTVQLNDHDISNLPPYAISRKGIAYVPQGRGIFPKLTVHENLIIGTRAQNIKSARLPSEVFTYFPILKKRLLQLGGTLSGGEQQMLAIARALCGNPKILLLDEPSEGIQPSIVQQLGDLITQIVENTNLSVLLVEQNIDLALQVARRFLVMEKGKIVHEGTADDFKDESTLKKFLAI